MLQPILQIQQLDVWFNVANEKWHILQNINLEIIPGQILAIVGPTGCGKSTLGKCILGFLDSNAEVKGRILFKNLDLLKLNPKALKEIYGKKLNIIFQEPLSSLDPLMKVSDHFHEIIPHANWSYLAEKWLNKCAIQNPSQVMNMYPHQLSTGMAQKVVFALTAANPPEFLVIDEPTASMDPVSQLVIQRLLQNFHALHNLSILLITHDIHLIEMFADRVIIIANNHIEQEIQLVDRGSLSNLVTEEKTKRSIDLFYQWKHAQ